MTRRQALWLVAGLGFAAVLVAVLFWMMLISVAGAAAAGVA
ncbi:hypothetical protein [Sandarakinorhabdus sp.]